MSSKIMNPRLLASIRNLNGKEVIENPRLLASICDPNGKEVIENPRLLASICDPNGKEVIENPRLLASVVELEGVLGNIEFHSDIKRTVGVWRYEDPGDGRLISWNVKAIKCNFASRTGLAFCQEDRKACFNIPELQTATDVWIKFDVFGYGQGKSGAATFRCYDETSGATGFAINFYETETDNCINMWINGTGMKYEKRALVGLHSFKLHLVSHETKGSMTFYLDDDTVPYYTYTGNVNDGKPLSGLYVQVSNPYRVYTYKALISNLVISNKEPSLSEVVHCNKVPHRYVNLGDGKVWWGTNISSYEYSRTGSCFYQKEQEDDGCFWLPCMDEIWVKFDLYHKEGSKRFRCYANAHQTTGICLEQNSTNNIHLFTEGEDTGVSIPSIVKANQIQTYIVHMKSGATDGKVEVWLDGEKIIDHTSPYSISSLRGFYLQSEDNSNLFSNLTVTQTENDLYIVDDGTDIDETSFPAWRFTDPGDGRLLKVNAEIIPCNFASRTGVGFIQKQKVSCFNIDALNTATVVWVKFDIFGYNPEGGNTSRWFSCMMTDSGFSGIRIAFLHGTGTDRMKFYVNGTMLNSDTGGFAGFHSMMLHFVSDKIKGKVEVYIDDETTPKYSYRGNVNDGKPLSNIYIQDDYGRAVFSNIIVTNMKPNFTDIVPYEKHSYKYTNIGMADGVGGNAITVAPTTKSNTGTAFYQTERLSQGCFNVPTVDEIWMRFDLYHAGGLSRFRCYANDNNIDGYGTGICLKEDTETTVALIVNGESVYGKQGTLIPNRVQSYLVHLKSGDTGNVGKVEVWIDDTQIISYTKSGIPVIRGLYLQSDDEKNLFSNIIISDKRECLGDSFVYHNDMRRRIKCGGQTHSYMNPGDGSMMTLIDESKPIEIVECHFASRTGIAFRGQQYIWSAVLDVPSLSTMEEVWVQFDIYAYEGGKFGLHIMRNDDEEDITGSGVCALCSSNASKGKLGFDGYNPIYSDQISGDHCDRYQDKTLIGFHTIKVYSSLLQGSRGTKVYIDEELVSSLSWSNEFGEIRIGSDSGVLISNIIVSDIEPMMDEVSPRDKTIYRYENLGTAEGLLTEGTTVVASAQQSRTGTAFYQTQRVKCFDIPTMDEAWIQFDIYHKGSGRFRCYANPSHNVGFTLPAAGGKTLQIYEGSTSGGISGDVIKTNQLQTILCHLKSGATNGLVEIWVDEQLVLSYEHPQSVAPLGEFYIQSDNANNLFSSVVITNNRAAISSIEFENNMDMLRQIALPTMLHADISRQIGHGTEQCVHSDMLRKVMSAWHFDMNVTRSDAILTTHCDTVRLFSRDVDTSYEGIATSRIIDLGKESTVGIGITIEGEGYAMISTAKSDENYTEWEYYTPCERTCRYIRVQLHVYAAIFSASLTIDRHVVSKTLSKHLIAGENTVMYGEEFFNIPAVIPTAIGDGLTAHVISKDNESCVIKITNGNEEAVEGDVDILVRGW